MAPESIGSSLPLMGIGNSRPGDSFEDIAERHSLPLMGIGNALGWAAEGDDGSSHYPSWGSETWLTGAAVRRALEPHYPSWGSETLRKLLQQRPVHVLITPHGDRKQEGLRHKRAPVQEHSLPLMGIGNPACGPIATVLQSVSLPLMGIGNPCVEH